LILVAVIGGIGLLYGVWILLDPRGTAGAYHDRMSDSPWIAGWFFNLMPFPIFRWLYGSLSVIVGAVLLTLGITGAFG
jgi:hypothetical protein